ncbi:sensor histidine kinase [Streptomyces profundus]|uniref:sensor histidine kinase n=1 Tax=Streptomyces profundus TaxID=2867410 RepID=UPI001D1641FE|nr:histidine kinase [Streptomyces sp. MA3_2.13]UED88079.1 sensor histidine kinase [Streptomyces sp. MA3_2.13]
MNELRPPTGFARRLPRQAAVDLAMIGLAAVATVASSGVLAGETHDSTSAVVLDQVVAGLLCGALWWRRRRPVALSLLVMLAGLPSHAMAGPMLAMLFTVAVHCRTRTLVLLVLAKLATMPINVDQRPESAISDGQSVAFMLVVMVAVISWGLSVRYRRHLRDTLYHQAQRRTREAIAREMHDVLAHRLSLLSVHAGALEYRADASPEQVREAAGVIRSSAHQALEELREVIGVLRAEPGEEPGTGEGERPQPTLGDLPRLVDEARAAGTGVRLERRTDDAEPPRGAVGRTAYRVVQEGLTNVRKHAPGAEATVTVTGAPGEGLTVRVANRLAEPPTERIPGARAGLRGLDERVSLAGGRLEHGRTRDDFLLSAWLPWPP